MVFLKIIVFTVTNSGAKLIIFSFFIIIVKIKMLFFLFFIDTNQFLILLSYCIVC